jgi:hypothetical protein
MGGGGLGGLRKRRDSACLRDHRKAHFPPLSGSVYAVFLPYTGVLARNDQLLSHGYIGVPKGIRTPVTAVKGRSSRRLWTPIDTSNH